MVEIVESMVVATRIGEAEWVRLLDRYRAIVAREISRHRGCEFARPGAGIVATFDGPARAIVERSRGLGIDVRAGVHTGECEATERDVRGPACQIAAWLPGRAERREVVVSSTITDLVAGSGIEFDELDRALTIGTNRHLRLYRVTSTDSPQSLARNAPRVAYEPRAPLSPRELGVAALIARGFSNRMIAEELSISIATVERHAANIFNKLGVRARASVAVWAAENDLLSARQG